jgi:hypothetical protein
MWVTVAAVVATAAAAGCQRRRAEIDGIGRWKLGVTTLAEAGGVCSPDEITFCSHAGTVPIGSQQADVNLYFAGRAPQAPLIEIELTIRGCNPDEAGPALTAALGEPTERRDKRMTWKGSRAYIAGRLPLEGRRCVISFVPATDAKRIGELAAE